MEYYKENSLLVKIAIFSQIWLMTFFFAIMHLHTVQQWILKEGHFLNALHQTNIKLYFPYSVDMKYLALGLQGPNVYKGFHMKSVLI